MPTHIHLILEVEKDLPYYTARKRSYHLGDLVRGFKQGCTSLFKRWMGGESVDRILSSVNDREAYTTTPGGKSDVTLWEDKYNDRVLMDDVAIRKATEYVEMNAFYWKLETDYPNLFEHELHLTIAGTDYSAYGCMFLLKRPKRMQVMCHRLAMKSMLTMEEMKRATASWDEIRRLEQQAREQHLGHFERDWYRCGYDCKTPVPYTETECFRKEKQTIIQSALDEGAVLVSPSISAGEKAIVYEALEQGVPVIKLQKDAITEKSHPVNKDRSYCARKLMLVLGAWKVAGTFGEGKGWSRKNGSPSLTNGSGTSTADRNRLLYTKFHNLNEMAADLCKEIEGMSVDKKTLEACR